MRLRNALLVICVPGIPLLLLVLLGKCATHEFGTLGYYDSTGQRIESSEGALRLSDFALVDQFGHAVNADSLRGTIWLTAFFSIDPATTPYLANMTKQLLWPNWRYRDEADVGTLCFSLRPALDRPADMQAYVQRNTRYNGAPGKWLFLTGDRMDVDQAIAESFLLERDPTDPYNVATLFLVDSHGYVRQKYLATSEHEIGEAVEDIALLKKYKKIAER
jgi:cytochrome oxidase Cu insertion factor (SCO1/SenC/PrrC family)